MAQRRKAIQQATLAAVQRRLQIFRDVRPQAAASSHFASNLLPVTGGITLTLAKRRLTLNVLER